MAPDWLGWVPTALLGAFGWLWNQDRRNQNERVKENAERVVAVEKRLNDQEQNRITRAEFNGVAESIRKEFHTEHLSIVHTMTVNNNALREEMRANSTAITERIDRLIEKITN